MTRTMHPPTPSSLRRQTFVRSFGTRVKGGADALFLERGRVGLVRSLALRVARPHHVPPRLLQGTRRAKPCARITG